MKKSIYTLKMYDYSNKEEAEKDIPKMREKGYMVKEQYQSENTYVVSYHKDTLQQGKGQRRGSAGDGYGYIFNEKEKRFKVKGGL